MQDLARCVTLAPCWDAGARAATHAAHAREGGRCLAPLSHALHAAIPNKAILLNTLDNGRFSCIVYMLNTVSSMHTISHPVLIQVLIRVGCIVPLFEFFFQISSCLHMHQQSSEYVWTTPRWGCRVLEGMPPCLQGGPRRGGPRRGRSGKKLTLPLIAFGLSLSCTGAPMFIGRIYCWKPTPPRASTSSRGNLFRRGS